METTFIYTVELVKTLLGIYVATSITTTAVRKYQQITTTYQPIHISYTNSRHFRNTIWKCVRSKPKKMALVNNTLTRKETTLYQTATLYWSRQEKTERTPSRACLPSSHPLRMLKVVL